MKFTRPQMIAVSVIALALGSIVYKALQPESSVTFFTPAEVYAAPQKFVDRTFRVSGLVLNGTKDWDGMNKVLKFRMSDLKGHDFSVVYKGIPPDLFKEGQGVVVEGRLSNLDLKVDSTIQANLLMVKHSEVYDTKNDHSKMREARLVDDILKHENKQ
ncbi:cytochrome c maturation protein CcmE [bacterium]|nr:cytochrome c maturation protein CcmE [bacterium]